MAIRNISLVRGRHLALAALLLSIAGLVATCSRAATPGAGGVHGSVYAATIRDRIGLVADAAAEIAQGIGSRIYVPEFEVVLVNDASGAQVASTKTDVFGRFYFRYQLAGTYRICWSGPGWVAGCSPEKVTVNNNISYVASIAVNPEFKKAADGSGVGAFWGRVKLADGSSPFFAEEFFAIQHTADVTVTDLAGNALQQTVTNASGEFIIVGVPASQLRTAARMDATRAALVTPAAVVASGGPIVITLSNSRPILRSLAAAVAGRGVREASQGALLDVAAEVRDPDGDPLTFTWKPGPGSGRIVSTAGAKAVWQLENASGQQALYVLVSDGNGGETSQSVSIKATGSDVSFAGTVLTQTGVPIAKPTVNINGASLTGDTNGAFFAKVPRADRYVVNVSSPNFAPTSRIFDQSGLYNEYRLVQTTVTLIDPTAPAEIADLRKEGRARELRPAVIRLEAGSLVGSDGKAATGPILARIATIDVANAEMPGDYGARSGGREVNLLSYGAVYAEFVDAAGNRYKVAPGKTAEVVLPPPAALKNPPPTIALWSYNEQTGYWDDLNMVATFDAARNAYVGKVPGFSTINTDIAKTNAACVRVLLDNVDRSQLKARVTYDSGGTPFAQTPEFVLGDALNAIYRLPENTNVKITVLDATNNNVVNAAKLLDVNQQVLANNVINTGPASQPLWPATPYENCATASIRLDVPVGNISRIPFLQFKGVGSEPLTVGYYKGLDSGLSFDANTQTWSGGTHSTLGAWWTQAGFDPATGAGGTRAAYLNHNDLGLGRDMHIRKAANGDVFAYVTNYGKADQNPANADDALNQTLAKQGASVAMEFTSLAGLTGKVVKFFVFNSGQPTGRLINSADLDGFGQKFVPNLCTTCHGGEVYFPVNAAAPTALEVSLRPSAAATVGSSLREFDTDSFKYPGGLGTLPAASRQSFFDLNQLVKDSNPQPAITAVINGWYNGLQPTDPPNSAFTPSGWIDAAQPQKQQLYQQVVARTCRTCHLAFSQTSPVSGINWTAYPQFQLHRTTIQNYVCGANKYMPHALMTYRNFWLLSGPHRPTVLGSFTASDWAAFAAGCQ